MSDGSAKRCPRTGLTILPSLGERAFRVARRSYGPLNPLRRPAEGGEPNDWGRFDTRGGRTAYCAATVESALTEALSALKRPLGASDLAADRSVAAEWAELGHLPPGQLPQSWRAERRIYELQLPVGEPWVLLEDPDSIAVVEHALGDRLAQLGVRSLTVAVLRGEQRDVTTSIAHWVREQLVGDEGAPACGIAYLSKHAAGWCRAYWLRRVDDGQPYTTESARVIGESTIEATDPALLRVLARFGLRVW